MLLKVSIAIPTVIVFLFLFWRRLREDYPMQSVFTAAFYILFGLTTFYILSIYFLPEWWFWISFSGAVVGLQISKFRFDFRLAELIDASVLALNTVVFSIFFYSGSVEGDYHLYFLALINIFLFIIFWLLDKNYKRFAWYRSGKIGFAGLFSAGLYFLSRSAVALYFPDMLSFTGMEDAIISAILAFLSYLGLYNLARQTE